MVESDFGAVESLPDKALEPVPLEAVTSPFWQASMNSDCVRFPSLSTSADAKLLTVDLACVSDTFPDFAVSSRVQLALQSA